MDFSVEKKISSFIESQFPQFYLEEGTNFIAFVKAYYQWMESEGGAIYGARNIFDFRDIDNTPDTMPWNDSSLNGFLEHFQRKYLYSIPFSVIINKRFLLKHILDVYRSKGTIQCYKLLFRLIYNEDVDVYLPGVDVLRLSDGKWFEPKYLEVSDSAISSQFVGNRIIGLSSTTTATVENYSREPINENIINTLSLSSILPKGASFIIGERLITINDQNNGTILDLAPTIIGSLDSLNMVNGGQDYQVGDVIKIAHRDINTGALTSYGIDGTLIVTETTVSHGSIYYNILNGGSGLSIASDAHVFQYKTSANGTGATFGLGSLAFSTPVTYNTDLISDYLDMPLNSATYGLPGNTAANSSAVIGPAMTYSTKVFGSLATLTNQYGGNAYSSDLQIFLLNTLDGATNLSGNISYNTTSNTINGTNTSFTRYFSGNSVIFLQANSSNNLTKEYVVIKNVANDTVMTLWGPPSNNSTSAAVYKVSPVILPSNFATYEPTVATKDGTIAGINTIVLGIPTTGNGVISKVKALNSGKGYIDTEYVSAYLYAGLNPITINSGGTGYANGDIIVFSGDTQGTRASGYVTTLSNGTIINAVLSNAGSGYRGAPTLSVRSKTGTGALLSTSVSEFNLYSKVTGKVSKSGLGRSPGFWNTDDGFLNSNKYIQDSYFYQDFSYQIKTAATLDKYKSILYETFHTSGSELFGEYSKTITESSFANIGQEVTTPLYVLPEYITIDDSTRHIDSSHYTIDQL
jgi:hypothetical protein